MKGKLIAWSYVAGFASALPLMLWLLLQAHWDYTTVKQVRGTIRQDVRRILAACYGEMEEPDEIRLTDDGERGAFESRD